MIKVYKSLQQYIANKKDYFTIPQVVNLSYKHHALQLWEAEIKLYSNNIAVKFIDEWSWMDIYDNDGTYIGLYRVKKISPSYQGNSTVIVYKLVHAFSTMLDDVLLLAGNGLLAEQNVDSMNSMVLMAFMFSKQSTQHWTLVQTKYVGDNTGIKFTRQNGLLKYIYEALAEMGGKYSMIFDTTEYPWKAIIVEAKEKVDCRVRENYNLIEYNMDNDYAPYYNRLYVYGEKDILGAPIKDQREPIKEPEITDKMTQKQIDAAWKRYNESVKKRKEEDAKRIADDKAAWEKYNKDYKAWSQKQIDMQKARDAALKRRREEIAMDIRPAGGFFAALPPRPSTVPPPEKPHLQTRETGSTGMSIGDLNDGKPYIEDAEEVAKHGIVSRVLEFKDIKDPKLLMDTAKRIFESRQARTIDLRLTAIELNKVLEKKIPFDDFHLGQHLLMQTKDLGNLDLVIVGEGKNNVYGNPYDIDLEIVEVSGSAGAGSKPTTVSPTDMMLKRMQKLEKDILYARKSADGKNTIYTGEVEPSAPEINDIWYKTIQDPVTGKYTTEMYIWNGAIWVNPFENLKQAMMQVEENEKELDALREEADKSAKELEKNLELAKSDLAKDAEANRKTIDELNKELENKLTDLKSAIDNANSAAEKAVEEAKKLLNGDIDQLKTELTKKITDEAANIESKLVADTDKKIATTKADLLAQAKEIGDGVKTELNTQIGELSATIAETKSQADGLSTKISQIKQTVDGFSAKLLESEKTSNSNKTKISQIQNSVNSLSSTLSDITTTTDGMEKRLTTVEQTSTELKTLIKSTQENLGGKISNLNSRIETAEGSIAKIEKTTSDNSGSITKLNKRVSTAEGNITTISKNVDGLTTKTNSIQSTVDTNKATIASQKKEIDEAGTKLTTLTSSLTQTQDQLSGVITNYAKKTDLKGLATEEYTQTQINAKAGELSQTISSQKKELDNTIAGIKARPTYTIGSDGYWYKDGKKTDTLAKGVNGKDGATGKQGPQGKDGKTGPQGKPGVDGKDGHVLNVNISLTGEFRNHTTNNVRRTASATYDGTPITLNNDNTACYYATGNNNWMKTPYGAMAYDNAYRDYDYIQEKIIVTYKGLTAEAITRLDNINDGGEFGWNLLLEGDTKITDSTEYLVNTYYLDEPIPEKAKVTLVVRAKGNRKPNEDDRIIIHNSSGSHNALSGIPLMIKEGNNDEFKTYSQTGYWSFGKMANTHIRLYWIGSEGKYTPVSIEWVKLVYGDNPTMQFVPAKSEIYGKDAHLYTGTIPPKDTKQMWFNPNDMTTYVYINGKWVDMNKATKDKVEVNVKTINNLKQTDESIKSEIAQIRTSAKEEATKLNTLERDLNGTKSTVSTLTKDLTSAKGSISSNATQITQTNKKIQTILSDYVKKTDLKGYVTESRLSTVVNQKAGEITTTLSKELETVDKNIGVGNLLVDGGKKITDTKSYDIARYTLAEDIPEGTIVSLVIRLKGKREPNDINPYNTGGSYRALNGIQPKSDSDKEFRTYVVTDKWRGNQGGNTSLFIYFGDYKNKNYTPVSIEWAKLVYGSNPSLTFTPSQKSIATTINKVADTVDSHKRTIAALDTNFNAIGKDVASNVIKISTLQQNLESFKVSIENKDYMSAINQQAGQILFSVSKKSDGTVQSGKLQITPTGTYMSNGFIKTAHISDASITDAKIKTLSANKLTAGTIDAKKIRVINLDAGNITTGVLGGSKASWNLNTGYFINGLTADKWNPNIAYYDDRPMDDFNKSPLFTSFEIDRGLVTFRKQGRKLATIDYNGLTFWGTNDLATSHKLAESTWQADAQAEEYGNISPSWWVGDSKQEIDKGVRNLGLRHIGDSTLTISYQSKTDPKLYHPYIAFDNRKLLKNSLAEIRVYEDIEFRSSIYCNENITMSKALIAFMPASANLYNNKEYDKSLFIGQWQRWGLLINQRGVFWLSGRAAWGGNKAYSKTDRQNAALRITNSGDREYQGGIWQINRI